MVPDDSAAVRAATAAPVENTKGAALLALAAVVFTAEVVILRHLDGRATTGQVLLFRSSAQLLFAAMWLAATIGMAGLRTERLGLHAARGVLSLFAWWFYYASFQRLGLALATVLTFMSSLFVVALAGPVMGERVTLRRLAGTLAAFSGVIVVSRLGSTAFEPAVLLGLASACAAAGIVMITRRLAATERTPTIMFFIGIITVLGSVPIATAEWRPLAGSDLAMLTLMAVIGCFGMWLMIEAYRVGEVSALAPVPYLRLVFAALAGLVLFGEWPAPSIWLGSILVVAGALVVTLDRRNT